MSESNGRTRVLLLLTSTAGGVGLHAYYLAKYLPKTRFDVTVGFGPGYPLDDQIDSLNVPVERFSFSRRISPLTNLRGLIQLFFFLRKNAFDVICIECAIAGFIGRLAGWLTSVPVRIFVIQLHASHTQQSRFKQVVYRAIERAIDPITTRYVAVSDAMKRFGVDHGMMRADKVDVIYNGIIVAEAPRYAPAPLREEFGLQRDSLVIGTLARLEPQKGLVYLFQAAALVKERFDNVEYLIAGDGPLLAELEGQCRELGIERYVKFVGWQSDVSRVLGCIDVFCMPSLWESFGIAFAEAMAMERPIVATHVDGIPEVVKDGETGILVRPRDPEGLANAICTLLADSELRTQMGRAGRRRVKAKFTVEEMVHHYDELFEDLVRQECARGRERK